MGLLFQAATKPTACLERKYMRPEYHEAVCYIQEYRREELRSQELKRESQESATDPQAAAAAATLVESRVRVEYLSPPATDGEDDDFECSGDRKGGAYKMMTISSMQAGEYAKLVEESYTDDDDDDDDEDYEMGYDDTPVAEPKLAGMVGVVHTVSAM